MSQVIAVLPSVRVDEDPPAAWSARAFPTRPSDLDCLLDPAAPARTVDSLLCACLQDIDGRQPGGAEVGNWTVARRLDALLAIRLAGEGSAERVMFDCHACAAGFEAEIDLRDFRRGVEATHVEFEANGEVLRARVPTGVEHARWQHEHPPLRLVAASLIEPPRDPDDSTMVALDEALAAADPLRGLPLELPCPECGSSGRHLLDLELYLLDAFAQARGQWLAEIAALATRFHWAEADIAAMPRWRRSFYLAQATAGGMAST